MIELRQWLLLCQAMTLNQWETSSGQLERMGGRPMPEHGGKGQLRIKNFSHEKRNNEPLVSNVRPIFW
jgi:hypothetical protein